MAPASGRRHRPASRCRARPVRPSEFSTNGHGLGVPLKRHPSNDMDGVLVLLAVQLDLQGVLPHPARWDELWRSGSPTSCIPRVEPAPTNESSFQMTHMCFSHTTAASPKPNGPARCARSRRGSNAGGRLQSSLLPIDAHRRLSTNGSGPSRVNRSLSGEQPVTHRFPRVSVEDVVQRA